MVENVGQVCQKWPENRVKDYEDTTLHAKDTGTPGSSRPQIAPAPAMEVITHAAVDGRLLRLTEFGDEIFYSVGARYLLARKSQMIVAHPA